MFVPNWQFSGFNINYSNTILLFNIVLIQFELNYKFSEKYFSIFSKLKYIIYILVDIYDKIIAF